MKVITAILLIIAVLNIPACYGEIPEDYWHQKVSNEVGVDVSGATLISEMNTHGGFLGDGETFLVFEFSDDTFRDGITVADHWNALPLSKNLSKSMEMWFNDDNDNCLFPEVVNGYYYFRDRHSSEYIPDPYSDEELLERYSYNFTVAIYDADSRMLYYGELDT